MSKLRYFFFFLLFRLTFQQCALRYFSEPTCCCTCSPKCITCSGYGESKCTSCISGYELSNGKCVLKLSGGAIAGIVIGVVFFVVILIVVILLILKKRRKKFQSNLNGKVKGIDIENKNLDTDLGKFGDKARLDAEMKAKLGNNFDVNPQNININMDMDMYAQLYARVYADFDLDTKVQLNLKTSYHFVLMLDISDSMSGNVWILIRKKLNDFSKFLSLSASAGANSKITLLTFSGQVKCELNNVDISIFANYPFENLQISAKAPNYNLALEESLKIISKIEGKLPIVSIMFSNSIGANIDIDNEISLKLKKITKELKVPFMFYTFGINCNCGACIGAALQILVQKKLKNEMMGLLFVKNQIQDNKEFKGKIEQICEFASKLGVELELSAKGFICSCKENSLGKVAKSCDGKIVHSLDEIFAPVSVKI